MLNGSHVSNLSMIKCFEVISICTGKLNYLTLTDPTKVWMPDTFFRNEKEAKKHEIIVPNVYVRIYPNGDILYSIRFAFPLSVLKVCIQGNLIFTQSKSPLFYPFLSHLPKH